MTAQFATSNKGYRTMTRKRKHLNRGTKLVLVNTTPLNTFRERECVSYAEKLELVYNWYGDIGSGQVFVETLERNHRGQGCDEIEREMRALAGQYHLTVKEVR